MTLTIGISQKLIAGPKVPQEGITGDPCLTKFLALGKGLVGSICTKVS